MLWQAGQKREQDQQRDRLVELFVASRDAALDVLVSTGQAKSRGPWRLPRYARSRQRSGTPAERDATLAKLDALYPGIVKRADS